MHCCSAWLIPAIMLRKSIEAQDVYKHHPLKVKWKTDLIKINLCFLSYQIIICSIFPHSKEGNHSAHQASAGSQCNPINPICLHHSLTHSHQQFADSIAAHLHYGYLTADNKPIRMFLGCRRKPEHGRMCKLHKHRVRGQNQTQTKVLLLQHQHSTCYYLSTRFDAKAWSSSSLCWLWKATASSHWTGLLLSIR